MLLIRRRRRMGEILEPRWLLTQLVDFDADGDLDALYQNQWFANTDGEGAYVAHEFSDTPSDSTFADIDQDGDSDIVTIEPRWYENDGQGNFSARELPHVAGISRIIPTDVGANGSIDLVVIADDEMTLFENRDGIGDFVSTVIGPFSGVRDAGDFDGDGDLDLLTSGDGSIYVEENLGDRFRQLLQFQDVHDQSPHGSARTWHLVERFADVDGDGRLDVLATSHHHSDVVDVHSVNLLWKPVDADAVASRVARACGSFASGDVAEFHVSDVDNDGHADAWCYGPPLDPEIVLSTVLNDGRGNFDVVGRLSIPMRDIEIAAFGDAGDINGDGFVDYVADKPRGASLPWVDGVTGLEYTTPLPNRITGDANLDGVFDSSDLTLVFQAGEFEDRQIRNSTWTTGDWNGDGEFDSGDLVHAFRAGHYVAAGRAAATGDPAANDALLADPHASSLIFSPHEFWIGEIAASIHVGTHDPLSHGWR